MQILTFELRSSGGPIRERRRGEIIGSEAEEGRRAALLLFLFALLAHFLRASDQRRRCVHRRDLSDEYYICIDGCDRPPTSPTWRSSFAATRAPRNLCSGLVDVRRRGELVLALEDPTLLLDHVPERVRMRASGRSVWDTGG